MHHRQVPPIIRGSVQVGVGVNALGDERCRVLNVVGRCRLAFQRFFRSRGAIGVVGKPGDAEADEGNLSRVLAYTRGDAHNREAACGLDHLLVARAGTRVVEKASTKKSAALTVRSAFAPFKTNFASSAASAAG